MTDGPLIFDTRSSAVSAKRHLLAWGSWSLGSTKRRPDFFQYASCGHPNTRRSKECCYCPCLRSTCPRRRFGVVTSTSCSEPIPNDEGGRKEMPPFATHTIYGDWGEVVAHKVAELQEEAEAYGHVGVAGRGYTKIFICSAFYTFDPSSISLSSYRRHSNGRARIQQQRYPHHLPRNPRLVDSDLSIGRDRKHSNCIVIRLLLCLVLLTEGERGWTSCYRGCVLETPSTSL